MGRASDMDGHGSGRSGVRAWVDTRPESNFTKKKIRYKEINSFQSYTIYPFGFNLYSFYCSFNVNSWL